MFVPDGMPFSIFSPIFLLCLNSPVMIMAVPTHFLLVLPIPFSLYCYCIPINVLGILVLCFPSRTSLCVQLVSFRQKTSSFLSVAALLQQFIPYFDMKQVHT